MGEERRGDEGERRSVPEGTERHGAAKFRPAAADRQADTGDG